MNIASDAGYVTQPGVKKSEIYIHLDETDFSKDHMLNSLCVMPFMTAVCRILKFVSCVYENRVVTTVTNIRLFKGIIWRNQLIELQLKIEEMPLNRNMLKCILKQKNPKSSKPRFLWLPLYSMEVELGGNNISNNNALKIAGLGQASPYDALWDFITEPLICNIYDCPALFHGPTFQLLRKVGDITDNSIKGIAEFKTSNVEIDKFYDGAMQLILKFVWLKYKKKCLPHSGNNVIFYENLFDMKKYQVVGLELVNISNINEKNLLSFEYILYSDHMNIVSSGEGCVIIV